LTGNFALVINNARVLDLEGTGLASGDLEVRYDFAIEVGFEQAQGPKARRVRVWHPLL
jgi:hypothetical protein